LECRHVFRIKICGVTRVADAEAIAAAGADALGLNFYAKSPRYVEPRVAREIADAIRGRLAIVGVFVNAPAASIREIADHVGLDLVQLHGDEPPDLLADLRSLPVLRAMRLGDRGLAPVSAYLDECRRLGCAPQGILLDADAGVQFGGAGRVANWDMAAEYHSLSAAPRLVLAGGLTPDNVAQAIAQVRPAAVDTASGVESTPGHKDPDRVAAFVQAAQSGFDNHTV
jgi:phosphoribosylanthranilate isomerase